MELEAGSFDLTYMPKKDFRLMFTADSRLAEFAASKEAMAILEEKLPMAVAAIKAGDVENTNQSLAQMASMPFLGIPKAAVDAVIEAISQIKSF